MIHTNSFTGFLERTLANTDARFGHQQQSTPPFLNHHHDAHPATTTIHCHPTVTTHDIAIQSNSPPPFSVSSDNHPRCHITDIDVATKRRMTTVCRSSLPIGEHLHPNLPTLTHQQTMTCDDHPPCPPATTNGQDSRPTPRTNTGRRPMLRTHHNTPPTPTTAHDHHQR